jgi:hypothetical protein
MRNSEGKITNTATIAIAPAIGSHRSARGARRQLSPRLVDDRFDFDNGPDGKLSNRNR